MWFKIPMGYERIFLRSALIAGFCVALGMLGLTLTWEYSLDTPLLNYTGFLMSEYGFVPYRDFFETSMPGTFVIHYLIAATGLTGNVAFLLLNAVVLVLVAATSWWALHPVSRSAALLAAPMVVVLILLTGPNNIMQRDWLIVLPVTLALALVTNGKPDGAGLRLFTVGLLFGLVATIKPQLAAAAPIVVVADWAMTQGARNWLHRGIGAISISLAGFAVVPAAILLWLSLSGGLTDFLFMLREYLPLHVQQNFNHEFHAPGEGQAWSLGDYVQWRWQRSFLLASGLSAAICAILAWTYALRSRIAIAALIGLWGFYLLVPGLAGQYWLYHSMPWLHFGGMLAALAIAEASRFGRPTLVWGARFVLLLALAFHTKGMTRKFLGAIDRKATSGRVEEVATAIDRWLPEGGTVQPIDWTAGGTIHAMLRTKAKLGTSFLYMYHFQHHVSTSTNAMLRTRFLAELEHSPPDLVVEAVPHEEVSGWDTDVNFPEYDAFIASHYRVVDQTSGANILMRLDLAPSPDSDQQ
ncbi:hypothetical protein QKW60_14555 [Defluviimonas aestuarii]|uniref:hypothetical protein n=1 Tax=Albidovulum aestuarii TaxID=1130726 RepID=UPI002499EFF3|nr:hypothetical protein [Defluviimonas aestuarii]MDI3337635.1 hypothetical protein [Defluviimonas aestuarii]